MRIFAISYELYQGEFIYKAYLNEYLQSWFKIDAELYNNLSLRYKTPKIDNNENEGMFFQTF